MDESWKYCIDRKLAESSTRRAQKNPLVITVQA